MEEIETLSTNEAFAAALVARMLGKVEQFNADVVGLPIPPTPTMLSDKRCEWADAALKEELAEFNQACSDGDILEAADALLKKLEKQEDDAETDFNEALAAFEKKWKRDEPR